MKQKRLFSFIPLSLQNNILSHFILLPFALKTHLSLTLGMSLLSCHCSYSSYVAFFFFFYLHPSQNGQWQSLLAYFGLPSAHSCSRHSECLLSECVLSKWERGRECPPAVVSGPVGKDKWDGLPGLPRWLIGKEPTCNTRDARIVGSIPGLGRSPGERNGNPFQYSGLGNCMDRGAWRATVHGGRRESDMTECLSTAQDESLGGAVSNLYGTRD